MCSLRLWVLFDHWRHARSSIFVCDNHLYVHYIVPVGYISSFVRLKISNHTCVDFHFLSYELMMINLKISIAKIMRIKRFVTIFDECKKIEFSLTFDYILCANFQSDDDERAKNNCSRTAMKYQSIAICYRR